MIHKNHSIYTDIIATDSKTSQSLPSTLITSALNPSRSHSSIAAGSPSYPSQPDLPASAKHHHHHSSHQPPARKESHYPPTPAVAPNPQRSRQQTHVSPTRRRHSITECIIPRCCTRAKTSKPASRCVGDRGAPPGCGTLDGRTSRISPWLWGQRLRLFVCCRGKCRWKLERDVFVSRTTAACICLCYGGLRGEGLASGVCERDVVDEVDDVVICMQSLLRRTKARIEKGRRRDVKWKVQCEAMDRGDHSGRTAVYDGHHLQRKAEEV